MEEKNKSVFGESTSPGQEKVIKLNKDKEMVVDLKNIESLLNSIEFATSKIKDVETLSSGRELHESVRKLEAMTKDLPNESLLKNLSFEIEKISGLDKAMSKIRGYHIAVTAVLTAIITVTAMSWTQYDNELLNNWILSKIKSENYVVKKSEWQVVSNENNRVVLKKIQK